jgi:DNA-directed RNA polymerase subunit RPC12/RpoP
MTDPKISLKVVVAPAIGVVLQAPPVLVASEHSIDYTCGRCAAVLLHADEDQVHGVLIHCTECGSYNSTDA